MTENIAIIVAITSYKVISLFVGLGFGYMGYRLFLSGAFGDAGQMDVSIGDNKLLL